MLAASNDRIKRLRRLIKQRQARSSERAFVVEGPVLVAEALAAQTAGLIEVLELYIDEEMLSIPDGAAESTGRRRVLADWLVEPSNPLPARVMANRLWQYHFGRGIVETENDFGTQGSYPTHPELLDYLARHFIASGWSMKRLHELIVTSATYRQASQHRSELNEVDPLNRLLARQSRIRVDAEIIRDITLSASGLLNPTIGGPSVRPPQPDGVYAFTQTKKSWKADNTVNRFRRGLYTRFYRSAPYPMLTTFDAPDFQSVCTHRVRSNTPLQSLTMANDKALFEMAQGLARRLLTEVDGVDASDSKPSQPRFPRLLFPSPR